MKKTTEEIYMAVQEELLPNVNNYTLPEDWQLAAMEAYAAQQVAEANKWIDVKDRLPDNDTRCFIYDRDIVRDDAWYYPVDKEWWCSNRQMHDVTHWMPHYPLPAPPEK